jgi:hypothetical protein
MTTRTSADANVWYGVQAALSVIGNESVLICFARLLVGDDYCFVIAKFKSGVEKADMPFGVHEMWSVLTVQHVQRDTPEVQANVITYLVSLLLHGLYHEERKNTLLMSSVIYRVVWLEHFVCVGPLRQVPDLIAFN